MIDILRRLGKGCFLLTLLFVLVACGQKGALRLPDDSESRKQRPSGSIVEESSSPSPLIKKQHLE